MPEEKVFVRTIRLPTSGLVRLVITDYNKVVMFIVYLIRQDIESLFKGCLKKLRIKPK